MMHPYSTDSNERTLVLFLSSVASFLVVYGLSFLVSTWKINLPFWAGLPSWGAVNLFLLAIFNRWLWRWGLFRQVGLTRVPDLNGDWEGYVKSSYDNQQKEYPIRVNIRQTWNDICIILRSKESRSRSVLAGILTRFPFPAVGYIFTNEPESTAPQNMHAHRGTAELILLDDGRTLEGFYYSGRDRQRYGLMHIARTN